MRPAKLTYAPANSSTNGYVAAGSGATLTLAATSAGDGLAHLTSITTTTDQSGKTFLITGTDENGVAQTETVTGPNNTTVYGVKYFQTISSIVPSSSLGASTVNIGWKNQFVTPTRPFNNYSRGVACRVNPSGTINYTVQSTFSDNRTAATIPLAWQNAYDATVNLVSQTAYVDWGFVPPPEGMRVLVNSYSNGASLDLYIVHQGI